MALCGKPANNRGSRIKIIIKLSDYQIITLTTLTYEIRNLHIADNRS